MIGKLHGYVDLIRADHVLLNVAGVGYRIFASVATLEKLRSEKEKVSLFIETNVREDHIHLYGFLSETEQEMFTLLTTVQGVGNKMALAVLGVFSAEAVANIIMVQDIASLTRVSGIGKRIAERIVVELKNKLPSLGALHPPVSGIKTDFDQAAVGGRLDTPDVSLLNDAISALEHLGYSRMDAHRACLQVMQEGKSVLEEIIPSALHFLSRR